MVGKEWWGEVSVAEFRGLEWLQSVSSTWSSPPTTWSSSHERWQVLAKLCHSNLLLFIRAMREGEPVILTEHHDCQSVQGAVKGRNGQNRYCLNYPRYGVWSELLAPVEAPPIIHCDVKSVVGICFLSSFPMPGKTNNYFWLWLSQLYHTSTIRQPCLCCSRGWLSYSPLPKQRSVQFQCWW